MTTHCEVVVNVNNMWTEHIVLTWFSKQVNTGLSHMECISALQRQLKPVSVTTSSVYSLIICLFELFCLWRHSSSSWAHHSVVPAWTPADIQYLITATGWLDYRRHWVEYLQQNTEQLENFLLGMNTQRGHQLSNAYKHQQGQAGLSH